MPSDCLEYFQEVLTLRESSLQELKIKIHSVHFWFQEVCDKSLFLFFYFYDNRNCGWMVFISQVWKTVFFFFFGIYLFIASVLAFLESEPVQRLLFSANMSKRVSFLCHPTYRRRWESIAPILWNSRLKAQHPGLWVKYLNWLSDCVSEKVNNQPEVINEAEVDCLCGRNWAEDPIQGNSDLWVITCNVLRRELWVAYSVIQSASHRAEQHTASVLIVQYVSSLCTTVSVAVLSALSPAASNSETKSNTCEPIHMHSVPSSYCTHTCAQFLSPLSLSDTWIHLHLNSETTAGCSFSSLTSFYDS